MSSKKKEKDLEKEKEHWLKEELAKKMKTAKKELAIGGRHVRGEIVKAGEQLAEEPGKWFDQFLKSLGL